MPIREDFVQIGEKYMHPSCWTCKDCKAVVTKETHGVFRNEVYCLPCIEKWTNQDEDLKAKAAHDKLQARLEAMKLKKAQGSTQKQTRMLKPGEKLSYAELKAATDLPSNIDTNKKEDYLSDAEFASLFKVSRADFERTPKWKKDKIKKELGLF